MKNPSIHVMPRRNDRVNQLRTWLIIFPATEFLYLCLALVATLNQNEMKNTLCIALLLPFLSPLCFPLWERKGIPPSLLRVNQEFYRGICPIAPTLVTPLVGDHYYVVIPDGLEKYIDIVQDHYSSRTYKSL